MVLENDSFTWNEATNQMLGQREDWKKLIRQCPFAKAYRYIGEPSFPQVEIFQLSPNYPNGGEGDGREAHVSEEVIASSDNEFERDLLGDE
ncbi:UNVERIFIED_CONTAM: hypothetical protein Sindi_1003100 [Sesamum indicum]